MPNFHFNLEDGHFIASRGDQDCDDVEMAREVADEIAEHLLQARPELFGQGCAIVVRDSSNTQIYRAELDQIPERRTYPLTR
jgi:hypothetical protein